MDDDNQVDSSTSAAEATTSTFPTLTAINPLQPHARELYTQSALTNGSTDAEIGGATTSLANTYSNQLKIRAVDINHDGTHVVIGGFKTLRILRLDDDLAQCVEARDIRKVVLGQDWSRMSQQTRAHGRTLSTGGYDLETAKRDLFEIEDVAWSIGAFKHHIATAVRNGKIVLYDITRPGMHLTSYFDHIRQVHTLAFNPHDGRYLLSGSQDGQVKLWDMRTPRPAMTFPGRSEGVRDVRWSPTHALDFAFGTDNGTVQHWTIRENRQAIRKRSAHEKTCSSIDWHPDGQHIASGGLDHTVKVWDMSAGTQSRSPVTIFRVPHPVQNLRWRPACVEGQGSSPFKHCTQLATSYREHPSIHVWDLRRPNLPFREVTHWTNSSTTDMAWRSRDLLCAVGPTGDFQQYDIPFADRPIQRRPPASLVHLPDGRVFFTATVPPKSKKSTKDTKSTAEGEELFNTGIQNDKAVDVRRPRSKSSGPAGAPKVTWRERTLRDDGLDEHFLRPDQKRHMRSMSAGRRESVSYQDTPPDDFHIDLAHVETSNLAQTLRSYKPFKSRQRIYYGYIFRHGYGETTQYLAHNYRLPPFNRDQDFDQLRFLQEACLHNEHVAKQASLYREAFSWASLALVIKQRLRRQTQPEPQPDPEDGVLPTLNTTIKPLLNHFIAKSPFTAPYFLLLATLTFLPTSGVVGAAAVAEDPVQAIRALLAQYNINYYQAMTLFAFHEEMLRKRHFDDRAAEVRRLCRVYFPEVWGWMGEEFLSLEREVGGEKVAEKEREGEEEETDEEGGMEETEEGVGREDPTTAVLADERVVRQSKAVQRVKAAIGQSTEQAGSGKKKVRMAVPDGEHGSNRKNILR